MKNKHNEIIGYVDPRCSDHWLHSTIESYYEFCYIRKYPVHPYTKKVKLTLTEIDEDTIKTT